MRKLKHRYSHVFIEIIYLSFSGFVVEYVLLAHLVLLNRLNNFYSFILMVCGKEEGVLWQNDDSGQPGAHLYTPTGLALWKQERRM